MRKLLTTIAGLALAVLSVSAAEVWPDGTKMDKWFTTKPAQPQGQEAKRFVITDYGVVRDSTVLQTEAIQKVIDLAAEKGGGTIVIPQGTFLTSSLFFKSKTHLYLEKGAVL